MLNIAVQTAGIEEIYGAKEAYGKIREWGFDAVDANIDHLLGYRAIVNNEIPAYLVEGGEEFFERLKPWRDGAKETGLANYQAHAPFPSYVLGADGANQNMLEVLKNMIRGCDYLDCRNLIIHPFFAGYGQMSRADEKQLNLESYAKLIPAAKEYGVTVCLENMFTGHNGKIYAACCSDIGDACDYIDTLNELAGQKVFGFCLDTGHALLCSLDIKDTMIELGDRICALHVHDNDGRNDQHLAPYMGVLDWDRFMEGLRAIGFNKTLSFETFNACNVVNKKLLPELERFIARCGRVFTEGL